MKVEDKETSSPPVYQPLRYVYYRVYATYGPIPSKRASDPTNPFIGPSLKRTLAHAECIPDPLSLRTDLYRLPSDETPIPDAEVVPILGTAYGTAATPADALALVFVDSFSDEEEQGVPQVDGGHALSSVAQDVYYRLHTRHGEDFSASAFDLDEPALGRIDISIVAPPRDALAIKRSVARAEGKPVYAFADLYTDLWDGPVANNTCISVGAGFGEFRGSSVADALRLVQPERRPGLYNRPLQVLQAQKPPSGPNLMYQFQRLRRSLPFPWLEVFAGDIVHTDGVIQMVDVLAKANGVTHGPDVISFNQEMFSNQPQPVYTAVNAVGVRGLIRAENIRFLDE
ncbi:hypothetical protein K438DRAFT_1957276 [Mycena galopus ATCC 62051]|nr:hypothetical protein K438DRAFT_1957276 [Mycena galopus ATCC 62051]